MLTVAINCYQTIPTRAIITGLECICKGGSKSGTIAEVCFVVNDCDVTTFGNSFFEEGCCVISRTIIYNQYVISMPEYLIKDFLNMFVFVEYWQCSEKLAHMVSSFSNRPNRPKRIRMATYSGPSKEGHVLRHSPSNKDREEPYLIFLPFVPWRTTH